MKFIGHLDVMRYFQKAIRRADLPVVYSEGFSPHMLMSFASPLGVGKTSLGEYFDLDISEGTVIDPAEAAARLQAQMADGITVVSAVEVSMKKADKCMSQVAAADYTVRFREGKLNLPDHLLELAAAFTRQPSIEIMRKTKTSEKITDIRPWIYSFELEEGLVFSMKLAAGSIHNLKPELVMDAFAAFSGFTIPAYTLMIQREEVYGENSDGNLIPLSGFAIK